MNVQIQEADAPLPIDWSKANILKYTRALDENFFIVMNDPTVEVVEGVSFSGTVLYDSITDVEDPEYHVMGSYHTDLDPDLFILWEGQMLFEND